MVLIMNEYPCAQRLCSEIRAMESVLNEIWLNGTRTAQLQYFDNKYVIINLSEYISLRIRMAMSVFLKIPIEVGYFVCA